MACHKVMPDIPMATEIIHLIALIFFYVFRNARFECDDEDECCKGYGEIYEDVFSGKHDEVIGGKGLGLR